MCIRLSRRACYKGSDARSSSARDPGRLPPEKVADRPNDHQTNTRWNAAAAAAIAAELGCDAVGEQYSRVENVADGEEQDPVADGCDAA